MVGPCLVHFAACSSHTCANFIRNQFNNFTNDTSAILFRSFCFLLVVVSEVDEEAVEVDIGEVGLDEGEEHPVGVAQAPHHPVHLLMVVFTLLRGLRGLCGGGNLGGVGHLSTRSLSQESAALVQR